MLSVDDNPQNTSHQIAADTGIFVNMFPSTNKRILAYDNIWLQQDGAPQHFVRDVLKLN